MPSDRDEWKHYEDFSHGIDANRLPTTRALAGTELTLSLADGTGFHARFEDAAKVHWRAAGPDGSGWSGGGPAGPGESGGPDWYEAVEVDDSTYFIDMTFTARPREALTVVANLASGRALTVRSTVAEEAEAEPGEPRVRQRFVPAVVAGQDGSAAPPAVPTGPEPAPTRDLVGRRALYRYSPAHVYEHVYLSSRRYCWQCLVGVQRGHGDCDLATTWKFAEDRYVFAFREFRIPVAAVFFYNMDTLRSTGKFLGVTSEGAIENSPAGAHIIPLGRTDYPEGLQPV